MSQKEKEVQNGSAQPTVKKKRRGISNETRSVDRLKFHERDAANNGLFVGQLSNVAVEWYQDANGKQFTGHKVPRLNFEFTSCHSDAKEVRYYNHSLFAVESSVDTIPGGKNAFMVERMFQFIKHMLDTFYLNGRELTEEEEDLLSLPFEDFELIDENTATYVPVDVEDVISGYATLFTNVANLMNGNIGLKDGESPKPCYKDKNGRGIKIWMKLLRCTYDAKNKQWRNVIGAGSSSGDLGFGFVGTGLIEKYVEGKLPVVLNINLAKESITPKPIAKAPVANPMSAVPGMGAVAGGMPAAMPQNAMANPYLAGAEAQGDMPF